MLQLDPSQRPTALNLDWSWTLVLKNPKICGSYDSDDSDADGLSYKCLHRLSPSGVSLDRTASGDFDSLYEYKISDRDRDAIQGWLQDVSDRSSEEGMGEIEEVNEMSTSDDVENQD